MKFCSICNSVYLNNENECRHPACVWNKLDFIDDDIIYVISEFNSSFVQSQNFNKIYTKFSCGGHLSLRMILEQKRKPRYIPQVYILFGSKDHNQLINFSEIINYHLNIFKQKNKSYLNFIELQNNITIDNDEYHLLVSLAFYYDLIELSNLSKMKLFNCVKCDFLNMFWDIIEIINKDGK